MNDRSPTLVWFRHDLRLSDNPALTEALLSRGPIIPVFIWNPHEEDMGVGAASRWWLHQSLKELDHSLQKKGSRLILRTGKSAAELETLIEETGATKVFWNRRYEPAVIKRDTLLKSTLTKQGVDVRSFKAQLLFEPWQIQTDAGKPYQVFTRFWQKIQTMPAPEQPIPAPSQWESPEQWPASSPLEDFKLEPSLNWAEGFKKVWNPGEQGAQKALSRFLKSTVVEYNTLRDIPAEQGTSGLSAHLHFGEISPRQIWKNVSLHLSKGAEIYLKEIGWREFAHHLIYHFPDTVKEPLHKNFSSFPWKKNSGELEKWQKGQTGYPIVDAGLRELWTTGWMHNRVRMIVASFLVKDLRLSWQQGAQWFWDTLVDADLANNTLGWQWSAGCGADAAPYFRIFNPTLQGQRFDPKGIYVRRWIPELTEMPKKWIHDPWNAPPQYQTTVYPRPMVDHGQAREEALIAFKKIKGK